MRTLREQGRSARGVDLLPSAFTDRVGSIVDRRFVADCMRGVDAVLHVATLHKPHVATHARQAFIDVNITGTLNLLEEAARVGVGAFVFTSTTSVFGDALRPAPDAPSTWITEDVAPLAKNIYGATKTAAEDLCRLFHRNHGVPCLVLRTSRFFPEDDDEALRRNAYSRENLQVCELLYRRVDLADVVDAELLAIDKADDAGFDRFIISASTPFAREDRELLRSAPCDALDQYIPNWRPVFEDRGWKMLGDIERVYDNHRARDVLGWRPRYDFAGAVEDLARGRDHRSPLARAVGVKGYHPRAH